MKKCFVLIKESNRKLEYVKLYGNVYTARRAMRDDIRESRITSPSYSLSSCDTEIIIDVNKDIYLKWYVTEMEVND